MTDTSVDTILKHMKLMEGRLMGEINSLKIGLQAVDIKVDGVKQKVDGVKQKVDGVKQELKRVEKNLSKQIDQVDNRLQDIEDVFIGQKHEERITRLEQRVGVAA